MLVTGAAGFTGRHLVAALLEAGAKVRAVLRPGGSLAEFPPQVEVVSADLRLPQDCARAVAGINVVFHAAAVFRTVGVSFAELYESHVTATSHLFDAASEAGARRVVHVSTIGVQGPNPPPNATERAPAAPADDYQQTKLAGEQMALHRSTELDLEVVVVRPCAIYGAGDDRFLKIIRPIARRRFPMIGAGSGRFHLVHVKDLVAGLLLAGQCRNAVGGVFTLGGAEVPTLAEFIDLLAASTGGGRLPVRLPYGPIYAASFLCEKLFGLIGAEPPLHRRRVKFFASDRSFDLRQARSVLGYESTVSLADGIRELVDWHRTRGDL